MRFEQKWQGVRLSDGFRFDARVPGNIQSDYARAQNWGDVNYGLNFQKFKALEDDAWLYETRAQYHLEPGERLYFVSLGIDYRFDILIDGEIVFSQEGMFTPVALDLTDKLAPGDLLAVKIHPHPKRAGAPHEDRQQADQCLKPPVSYGWDWHPRVIPSGLWDETYLETRTSGFIRDVEPFYELAEDYSAAEVRFEVDADAPVEITLYDAEGQAVGQGREMHVRHPRLWWCNGQGEPYLYRWEARTAHDRKEGYIGFRRIRLVMAQGAWAEPAGFPKSRSAAPATLELNGRRIFAKGSNWVNPEIFPGEITPETYARHIALAKEAHMNIFRCWGGSGINKRAFYDLCDRAGLLLWVEFPLACNDYAGTPHYLKILEQEASSILRRLRRHPSVALWCGGNELFNGWSGMTDQSLALRLLNKLCYELDRDRPFLMTSPLCGMAHGGYTFYDDAAQMDVFQLFQHSKHVAYTEFGVPGTPDEDYLSSFIPESELFPMERGGVWEAHHAFGAWGEARWLCLDVLKRYGCRLSSLAEVVEYAQWLQCEGYKAIFEEARRQRPLCGMAINWCWCEPWKTAANNSLISYPILPKKAYFAVRDALRPALFSARIPRFDWKSGDLFSAELWLLNDSPETVSGSARAVLEIGGTEYELLNWQSGSVAANENRIGPSVNFRLPEVNAQRMTLRLISSDGLSSSYTLKYTAPEHVLSRQMNV